MNKTLYYKFRLSVWFLIFLSESCEIQHQKPIIIANAMSVCATRSKLKQATYEDSLRRALIKKKKFKVMQFNMVKETGKTVYWGGSTF